MDLSAKTCAGLAESNDVLKRFCALMETFHNLHKHCESKGF